MDRDIQALGASFAKPQEKAASIVYETEAQYRERIERDHRMEWEKDGAKPAPGHFLDYMKWQKEAPVREAEAPVKPGAEAAAKAAASAAELVEQQAGRMDLDVKFSFEAAANAPGMRETAPAPHDFSQTVPDAMNLDYLDNEPAAASPDSPALRPTALENQVVDDLAARFAGVSLNVQQRADSLTLLEGKLAQADSNHSAGAGKTADSDAAAKTPPVFTFGNWGDNFAAHIDTMFGGGLAQDRGTEEAAAVQQPAEARRALEKGPRDKVIAR